MDNRAIGVFDSGLGGLTTVKELHRILPQEDIIYLGDTGRVPYGSRSRETIIKYARQDIAFLLQKDIKMVVDACGTVSSTLPREISANLPVPYLDIVLPAAQQACAMTSRGRIGVVGTNATLRSNAFGKAIHNIRADVQVYGNPCPLLVHLVENGLVQQENPITRLTVQMYQEPLMKEQIDTLILGCTHYPLLYDIFNELLDYQVTLIDPGRCAAGSVRDLLMKNGQLAQRQRQGITEYNVTDETESFNRTASIFLGEQVKGAVNRIELG